MKPMLPASILAAALISTALVSAGPSKNIDIADFKLAAGPVVLEGVADNASGLTYCRESESLFCVLNGPTHIVELGLDGSVKRRINLAGFHDTEGIIAMGKGRFAVVEERRRKLVLFTLDANATSVSYDACEKTLIDAAPAENKGLEGITFDPKTSRFYILKEKQPRKLYAVEVKDEGGEPQVKSPWDLQKKGLGLSDVSGLHFDPATGHLLILSHESRTVVETTIEGKEISRLKLAPGNAGLTQPIPQPEGICLDDQGNLYICGEPNTFYLFRKQ
jgi:uncharacterized protein YjiK